MMPTPKPKDLYLASSLRDGLEDNNLNQVATLLEHNEADPNVLLPMHGVSPFHLVIGNESETFAEDVTRLFLRHGGDPNVESVDGMTPVHVAAAWGRLNVLELLLANGGDPVALDDEGRSPFHYAFDGAYYEAIALLAKYCPKRQEEDEESLDSDGPKIQIKLEKILVNRGDVIAEYVPSETDLTEDSSAMGEMIASGATSRIVSKTEDESSDSFERSALLQSNNVTLRKDQTSRNRQISPILCDSRLTFDKDRSFAEERILIGEIIHSLSDSFNKTDKDHFNSREKESNQNEGKPNFCSLLPKPKYFKKDLGTPKKDRIFPVRLDHSIISTSPNFKIAGLKREDSPAQNKISALQTNITPKGFGSPSAKTACDTPKVRSASSTPKRKRGVSKIFQESLTTTPKTPLNKTYQKNNAAEQSADDEGHLKIINKRFLSKEFVRKLEKSFDEEVDNLKGKKCNENSNGQYPKIPSIQTIKNINNNNNNNYNNIAVKNVMRNERIIDTCNSHLKKLTDKNDRNTSTRGKMKSSLTPQTMKNEKKNDLNVPVKSEDKKFFFESPGSSNPRSLTSSPKRESTSEEIKLWNEIDELYREKGRSPLASVSQLTNESSDNTQSTNSGNSSTTINCTLASIDGKSFSCREDAENATHRSEDSDVYKTPLISTMSSRCSIESFFSVDEEYAYVDSEKNVAFLERRLRVVPSSKVEDMDNGKNESTWIDMLERLSLSSASSVPTSDRQSSIFSGDYYSLRCRLIALGEAPGPITNTTFQVYLKRLRKLEKTVNLRKELGAPSTNLSAHLAYPKTIPNDLLSTDWITDHDKFRVIEHNAFKEYDRPSARRNYRGGVAKVSFNYLLLDPRVTNDLPRIGRSLSLSERWKIFLEAIFYIGKGKSARPAAHLYDAFDLWIGKKKNDQPSDKLRRIMDIWKSGNGVVSLQVFSNSMQEEAFTREAAMIDALGSNNLSNCMRGQYYGFISTMSMREKKMLGKFLLYNAMQIFMHEGERQLLPRNVE